MIIYSDPACLGYETPGHPERPFRVRASVELLERECPAFEWGEFEAATEEALLAAHSRAHLERLQEPRHFDADTAYHDGIYDLARLSAGAALVAMDSALKGAKAFSLMRPPGHHAEREQAMGFCYLNNVAIQALEARRRGVERLAVWDFDAHHGNGTEAILRTGAQRLRPVMLTTVTTALGLMPMATGVNVDFINREVTVGAPFTQWWSGLAIAVVFGPVFATALTLLITPSALMLRERWKMRRGPKEGRGGLRRRLARFTLPGRSSGPLPEAAE